MSKNFVLVFQRKAQGNGFPKVGLPSSVQPGDYLTFFLGGAYHTREVGSVHNGYVMTLPLEATLGGVKHTLDTARKVLWADMDSSERRITSNHIPAPATSEPMPIPPKKRSTRVAPEPEPEPPLEVKAKPPKATATEALDLWSLLGDE